MGQIRNTSETGSFCIIKFKSGSFWIIAVILLSAKSMIAVYRKCIIYAREVESDRVVFFLLLAMNMDNVNSQVQQSNTPRPPISVSTSFSLVYIGTPLARKPPATTACRIHP